MSAGMVVLFINRSESRCGACGLTALPHEPAHTTPCGYDQHDGCGATFTHVSSDYMGDDMRVRSQAMRPDLPWLDYAEAHQPRPPVTAAERATVMAAQSAAEARVESDCWTGRSDLGDDFKEDPRFRWDDKGSNACEGRTPYGRGNYLCTNIRGHVGRHIATAGPWVVAAWPGTHEPTLDDLGPVDVPEGDDLYHGLSEMEALSAATEGARDQAAEHRAAEPPALVLPDGWKRCGHTYASMTSAHDVYACSCGVDPYRRAAMIQPDEARLLAARLLEAAAIVEQLRAGAR